MGEQASEFRGVFSDVLAVTELRGQYPNVPISADVDYAALVAGDDAPVFLTLPIGKANVTSGNNRHYDEAFLQELERQTLAHKPIGLMGHLSESERATAFPPEAVHWVGAIRDGDTLWGKAYVVPGPVRDRIQRYKAQGKAIATSIDAFAEGVYDETRRAMRMVAKTLRLNQIDIAPADRAGIPDLAAVPFLTSEFAPVGADIDEMEPVAPVEPQEGNVDVQQLIQELAKAQPAPQRGWQPSYTQEAAELAAIRETLGADENTNLARLISEMKQREAEQIQAAIRARITELVSEGVKLESVRALITELVKGRQPQSVAEAEAAFAQVMEMASVKEMLAAVVQREMGPPAIVSGRVSAQNGIPQLEDTPENRQRAMSSLGIQV